MGLWKAEPHLQDETEQAQAVGLRGEVSYVVQREARKITCVEYEIEHISERVVWIC